MSKPASERVVMTGEQVGRTITRIAHEILEKNAETESLAIVGIHTRGVFLARRLHTLLREITGQELPYGELDIAFYRDDVAVSSFNAPPVSASPIVKNTDLSFAVDEATIVLVDDVLYTGRTIRAAIDALFDYGRPRRVQLAVLVDRGHRELPIRPDFIGKNIPTAQNERVEVRLTEVDGADEVVLVHLAEGEGGA